MGLGTTVNLLKLYQLLHNLSDSYLPKFVFFIFQSLYSSLQAWTTLSCRQESWQKSPRFWTGWVASSVTRFADFLNFLVTNFACKLFFAILGYVEKYHFLKINYFGFWAKFINIWATFIPTSSYTGYEWQILPYSENTQHCGEDHCPDGLQFYKFGLNFFTM